MSQRWVHCRRAARACVAAILLVTSAACEARGARRSEVASPPTRRLDGAWELTMRLDRRMSLSATPATLPFTLRGTVTMMTNENVGASFAPIAAPTAIGVYAIRMDSLGLSSPLDGDVPTLAARERLQRATPAGATRDSVLIVLNPASPTRLVRFVGALGGAVIRGEWTAESPLGGGGTFEMHRATRAPAAPK